MTDKTVINRYLFFRFDMELEGESPDDVTETWPFNLEQIGEFTHNNTEVTVYQFDDYGETYHLIDGKNLAYTPTLDFTVESLRLELMGSLYVESQEHVALDGNSTTEGPAFEVKERAILKLAKKISAAPAHILEGLYFFDSQEYLGLVQFAGEELPHLIGTKIHVKQVGHPSAPPQRRINVALGELVEAGEI